MSGRIVLHQPSNVLKPVCAPDGVVVVAHVVNELGIMGAGVALAIRKQWPSVFDEYERFTRYHNRDWHSLRGTVRMTWAEENVLVANCYAQHGIRRPSNSKPFDLSAFRMCLRLVASDCKALGMSLNMPYGIGCGLAGGDWDMVQSVIREICCERYGLDVHLHKLR